MGTTFLALGSVIAVSLVSVIGLLTISMGAAPLGAEEREILSMKAGKETAPAEDPASDFRPLPAASVKSYVDHRQPSRRI